MLLRILIVLLRIKGRLRRIRPVDPDAIRSILIVELTRLGDVLAALPAVEAIIRFFPQARITFAVDQQYAELVRTFGLACEVNGLARTETLRGFIQGIASVRASRFDLAISLSPPKRNVATTLASWSLRRVGYLSYSHTMTPYLEAKPVESFGFPLERNTLYGHENIRSRSLKVTEALGIPEVIPSQLTFDAALATARAEELRKTHRLPTSPYIAIHPFSGWDFRSWPLESFAAFAKLMTAQGTHRLLFFCQREEAERLEVLENLLSDEEDIMYFVSDRLVDTAALFAEASLVLCNDSGPLHLAAALGKPVVGLFGPASPYLTAPRSVRGTYIYKQVECSPCDQSRCIRPEHPCMALITPDEVFDQVVDLLNAQHVPESAAHA